MPTAGKNIDIMISSADRAIQQRDHLLSGDVRLPRVVRRAVGEIADTVYNAVCDCPLTRLRAPCARVVVLKRFLVSCKHLLELFYQRFICVIFLFVYILHAEVIAHALADRLADLLRMVKGFTSRSISGERGESVSSFESALA